MVSDNGAVGLGSKQSTRIHGYLLASWLAAGRIAELTGSIAYICQLHRAPVIGWLAGELHYHIHPILTASLHLISPCPLPRLVAAHCRHRQVMVLSLYPHTGPLGSFSLKYKNTPTVRRLSSALSVRVPGCQKYKWQLNPVCQRMLCSCTHTATVGVKGLTERYSSNHFRLPKNFNWRKPRRGN